ncbi:50S ribosomal protein L30e-like protein [Aspergillus carlsbadensis]|nr:50S ribosomal protein L30e-like protein [Aspergillus carlsbadensis]
MAVSSEDPSKITHSNGLIDITTDKYLFTAFPRADEALTQEILEVVKQASGLKLVKKGYNEAKKSVKNGQSQLVVIAADTDPIVVAAAVPAYCVGEDVPYIWVPSKKELGIACGLHQKVGTIVASINSSDSCPLAPQVEQLREKIGQLFL